VCACVRVCVCACVFAYVQFIDLDGKHASSLKGGKLQKEGNK
jgi:hypothetical protein